MQRDRCSPGEIPLDGAPFPRPLVTRHRDDSLRRHKTTRRLVAILGPVVGLCGISLPAFAIGDGGSGRGAPWVGTTFWGEECKGARIPFGPFDYTQRAKYQQQRMLQFIQE